MEFIELVAVCLECTVDTLGFCRAYCPFGGFSPGVPVPIHRVRPYDPMPPSPPPPPSPNYYPLPYPRASDEQPLFPPPPEA
jgi:hypothetical protein